MVSVIIPTYNRKDYIARSIASVQRQTYQNFEIIVIDDGSTDGTKELIDSFLQKDGRIKYIYQENRGSNFARNNGINHAKGKYISFLDSDDEYCDDKLECNIKYIQDTDADVIFSQYAHYDINKCKNIIPTMYNEGVVELDMLSKYHGVTTDTIFGKADVIKNTLFDEKVIKTQDFDFMLMVALKYKVYFLKKVLVNQYATKDSITFNITSKHDKLIKNMEYLLEKYKNIPSFINTYKVTYCIMLIKYKNDNPTSLLASLLRNSFNIKVFTLYIFSLFNIAPAALKCYSCIRNVFKY